MAASGGMWVKAGGSASGLVFVPRGEVRRRPGATFPSRLTGVHTVKSLGGSTGAKLVEDAQGNRYVMKRGNSPGHIREEGYADAAYRALGADVPAFHMYGDAKLSQFVAGTSLGSLHGTEKQAARAALRRHFVADALLGNYDVIGLDADNVLWDGRRAWRIDNGGSLRYRAQGKLKQGWGEFPTELWTMRDPSINVQAAKVFGSLSMGDIATQIGGITAKQRAGVLAAVPAELKPVMKARLDNLRHVATSYKTLTGNGVSPAKADNFLRRYMEGRAKGQYGAATTTQQLLALYRQLEG